MSIAQQTPNHREKLSVQALILSVGLLLLGLKFYAFYRTHSNAVLTDALESIINIVAGGFGLYSLFIAAKPHDEDHPYGHGKIEFISASIEGVLIALAGITMVIKAIYNFFFPVHIASLDLALVLIVVTGIVNYAMGHIAVRKGMQNSSLTLIASGEHLKSDAYSTVGLLIGLGLIILTNFYWLDNVVAILMGCYIVFSGYSILKKSVGGIMDAADFVLLKRVVEHINECRRENWIDIHNLRIIKFGEKIHIDCHTTIPWYFNALEVHDELKKVEETISDIIPNNLETFIHADPCLPASCKVCSINCPVRVHSFEEEIIWTMENVLKNAKHGIDK